MKHLFPLLLTLMLIAGCKSNSDYNRNEVLKKNYERHREEVAARDNPYPNLTKDRRVEFYTLKDYKRRDYFVGWYFWLDGDIVEMGGKNVPAKEIIPYQTSITKYADSLIPELLKIKW